MKKSAKGSGTIRRKTVTRGSRQYTYWEARITTGRDPGTGKQIQRSFTGKTQKEVRQKMQAAAVAVDSGSYAAPQKITVGAWLDVWAADYLSSVKPTTAEIYRRRVRLHLRPALGAVRLADLHLHHVQQLINGLSLSPATVRQVYKVLHQALEKAVQLGYIPKNPADGCTLPRMSQKEVHPLDDQQSADLLAAAKGGPLEYLLKIALFTGLRQSEILGLTWDRVDFEHSTITVDKQLTQPRQRAAGMFTTPKNGKPRTITAAPSAMRALRAQKRRQAEMRLRAGALWNNPNNLAFTTETGEPFGQRRTEKAFCRLREIAGLPDVRFHDTRHTYAVNAIRAGDNIKTIQGNLGHSSAAFTLDRYGHFTEPMQQESAARMESFIKGVLNL